VEAQPLLLSIVVRLHQEPLLSKEDIDSKPFTAKSPVPCLELRECCNGQSRNQNLQNLLHVFRGKRQVALTGVKGNVTFRNRCRYVASHSNGCIGIGFTMPKVDRYLNVLWAETPRADHERSIPLSTVVIRSAAPLGSSR